VRTDDLWKRRNDSRGFTLSLEIVMAKRITTVTGLVAANLMTLILSSAPVEAGNAEQQRACQNDAFTFCSSEIPDVKRITACMVRNLKRLSPECRVQFRPPAPAPEPEPARNAREFS